MKRAHVIGAGLAGLSVAVRLAKAGVAVTVHEAAPHAGGRCRSFLDSAMDAFIDNGRHLMLSGNSDVQAYLELIGASGEVFTAPSARFDFYDLVADRRWSLDFGDGKGRFDLLMALLHSANRPPGISAWTLLRDLRALARAGRETVTVCLGASRAFEVVWRPLAISVLNTPAEEAAAALLYQVLARTVLKGGAFARPLHTRAGLGAALVEPALVTLQRLGATVRFSARAKALETGGGRITGIDFGDEAEVLAHGDQVVLAVPHFAVGELLEGVDTPAASHAILNVHYHLREGEADLPPMTGIIGGAAEWVFVRGHVASVTVSAADAWMDKDIDAIAHTLWPEVARVLGLSGGAPAYRVIKERRATFAQTPDALDHRPGPDTAFENLFLAGDWTATGLPATIEGALKSGRLAAQAALGG